MIDSVLHCCSRLARIPESVSQSTRTNGCYNLMRARIIILLGVTLLVAIASLLLGISGKSFPILPLAGVGLTLIAYGLWQLREDNSSQAWDQYAPGAAAFAGIAISSLLRSLYEKSQAFFSGEDVVAIGLSLVTGGVVILLKRRRVMDRCHRCQEPLGKDRELCPRGGEHWVCTRCWLPERMRCKDCESFRTPLLLLEDENWWKERVGERVRSSGHCYVCHRNANEQDLRKCGQCTGITCLRCWDLENGKCAKCGWVIAELPDSLERFYTKGVD